MTRRILGIAGILLAGLMCLAAVASIYVHGPQLLSLSGRSYGFDRYFYHLALMLFPASGAAATGCCGYHLLRGSKPRSMPGRMLLHLSTGMFILFAALFGMLILGMALAYPNPRTFADALFLAAIFVPVLATVALYLTLLFWRGAVADRPRR
ncbi:MAG: hypothetical protein Q7V31_10590 [Parvibaculum sp.]|uniref:hypothetical protein n=1 Tax=Parvibaculum sp. TaxID=2024848 RepID=UPI00271E6950|nr:hypothetical protein [Parvibaculum sp.]MDO8839366.1 hypothetical protein [Parvibaculum sp.]